MLDELRRNVSNDTATLVSCKNAIKKAHRECDFRRSLIFHGLSVVSIGRVGTRSVVVEVGAFAYVSRLVQTVVAATVPVPVPVPGASFGDEGHL